jgi:hypothetical protein
MPASTLIHIWEWLNSRRGKNRDCGERHTTTFRHEIRRQRDFSDVEFRLLQHALVAIFAVALPVRLADDQDIKIDALRRYGAVEERHVTVVVGDREG